MVGEDKNYRMVDRQSLVLMWVTTNRYFLFQSVLWLCPPPHGFPASHSRLLLPKALCPRGSWDNLMVSQTSPQTSQRLASFGGGVLLLISIRSSHWLLPTLPLFLPTSTFWYPPASQTVRGRQMVTGHLENLPLLKLNGAQETEYLMTAARQAG